MRELTYALAQAETAEAALAAVNGALAPAQVEALVELLARPHNVATAPAAVARLAECGEALALDALVQALDSPLATVRRLAVEALAQRSVRRVGARLCQLLQEDDSWPVRRAALRALAEYPEPACDNTLAAADDPHWRVRHALIGVLRLWGEQPERRAEIERRLRALPAHPRIQGVLAYLQAHWGLPGELPPDHLPERPAYHDPDPRVMARHLEELGAVGRKAELATMPGLLAHEEERIRRLAVQTLRQHGTVEHLAAAAAQLDDRRTPAAAAVHDLFQAIDADRREAAARYILHLDDPTPGQLAWALDQAGTVFPLEEEAEACQRWLGRLVPGRCRAALARLAARWHGLDGAVWLTRFLHDPDPEVRRAALIAFAERPGFRYPVDPWLLSAPDPLMRLAAVRLAVRDPEALPALQELRHDEDARVRLALAEGLRDSEAPAARGLLSSMHRDPHPLVRSVALTAERAAALVAAPEGETSWHVLAEAARRCQVPLWQLEPKPPWQTPESSPSAPTELAVQPGAPPHARPLGPQQHLVAPVGISGHYGLPIDGFVRAVEAGVNLLFWEPGYQTLTQFATRLAPATRRRLHFLAGTFEATPCQVEKDVDRVLRTLKIDQIAFFLLFWTRGWNRITDELRGMLDQLRRAGKVGTYSLSTHQRQLAVEAIEAGWDPVMVRHSAAHRGAEQEVFPRAVARGTGVITFNNLCYGRLLQSRAGRVALRAADCYRYSLAQPGVTVCLSAPATLAQLEENLQVLGDPTLTEERKQELIEQGTAVYREETWFRHLVRSR